MLVEVLATVGVCKWDVVWLCSCPDTRCICYLGAAQPGADTGERRWQRWRASTTSAAMPMGKVISSPVLLRALMQQEGGLLAGRLASAVPGEVLASHLEAISGSPVSAAVRPSLKSLEFLEPIIW